MHAYKKIKKTIVSSFSCLVGSKPQKRIVVAETIRGNMFVLQVMSGIEISPFLIHALGTESLA